MKPAPVPVCRYLHMTTPHTHTRQEHDHGTPAHRPDPPHRRLRPARPEQTSPWVGHPGLTIHDTDPSGQPAEGYPHQYFAVHHPLPTERATAATGCSGSPPRSPSTPTLAPWMRTTTILNAQIDARLEQWLHAIDAAAARRKFIIEGLIAATSNYSIVANEQLHTTRAALTVAEIENRRSSLLLGDHPNLATTPRTRSGTLHRPDPGRPHPQRPTPTPAPTNPDDDTAAA